MKTCSKDLDIELDDGTEISCTVHVTGTLDENYGADADGNRGVSRWIVESHEVEHTEDLTEEQQSELDDKIEVKVDETDWDFDNAGDQDDEPSDDE